MGSGMRDTNAAIGRAKKTDGKVKLFLRRAEPCFGHRPIHKRGQIRIVIDPDAVEDGTSGGGDLRGRPRV